MRNSNLTVGRFVFIVLMTIVGSFFVALASGCTEVIEIPVEDGENTVVVIREDVDPHEGLPPCDSGDTNVTVNVNVEANSNSNSDASADAEGGDATAESNSTSESSSESNSDSHADSESNSDATAENNNGTSQETDPEDVMNDDPPVLEEPPSSTATLRRAMTAPFLEASHARIISADYFQHLDTFEHQVENGSNRMTELQLEFYWADQPVTPGVIQTVWLIDNDDAWGQSAPASIDANGVATFDLSDQSFVASDLQSDKYDVWVEMNSINTATMSQQPFSIRVKSAKFEDLASGDLLETADITVEDDSNTATLFITSKSQMYIDPLPNTGGGYEYDLANGWNKKVYPFQVHCDENGACSWKGLKFFVRGRASGMDLSFVDGYDFVYATDGTNTITPIRGFRLYEAGTNNEVQTVSGQERGYRVTSYMNTYGEIEIAIILKDGVEEVLAAGESKHYELRAHVFEMSQAGDYLEVGMRNQAAGYEIFGGSSPDGVDNLYQESAIPDYMVNMHGESANGYNYRAVSVIWSDNSGAPHLASNWIDGSMSESKDWLGDGLLEINATRVLNIYNF